MSLFAISDLHLSLGSEKPMDIFGEHWKDHHLKLKENWEASVDADDTVILGGDLSWAMKLEEARDDFNFVHSLPGKKVIFKGNHDYWWQSYAKVNEALPESIRAVQNNYFLYDDRIAICGTRGWMLPGGDNFSEQDRKVYKRELGRLELSLKKAESDGYNNIIAVFHYPPFTFNREEDGFTAIMRQFNVKICLYGHLHGADHQRAFSGEKDGIRYYFASSDYLKFNPLPIDLSIFG